MGIDSNISNTTGGISVNYGECKFTTMILLSIQMVVETLTLAYKRLLVVLRALMVMVNTCV